MDLPVDGREVGTLQHSFDRELATMKEGGNRDRDDLTHIDHRFPWETLVASRDQTMNVGFDVHSLIEYDSRGRDHEEEILLGP